LPDAVSPITAMNFPLLTVNDDVNVNGFDVLLVVLGYTVLRNVCIRLIEIEFEMKFVIHDGIIINGRVSEFIN
jgi:hypothetical protein